MIYSEIQNYLTQVTDPMTVELFDSAVEVFEKLNFEDYLDAYENAIGDTIHLGDVETMDALRARTEEMIDSLLAMHGVFLVDNALLADRIKVIHALANMADYEDKSSILLALESDDGDIETFAVIVGILSGLCADNVLSWVHEIHDGLLEKMKELVVQPEIERMPEAKELMQHMQEYSKYRIVFQNDDRWTERFVKHSEAIGLPFTSYATLYMGGQLKVDLQNDEELAMRKICVNLIGIGCLSDEGARSVRQNAHPYMEQIYPDMSQLTRLDIKLSSLLTEFHNAQT